MSLRAALSRPANVIAVGVLWGLLYYLIGIYLIQAISDGTDSRGLVMSAALVGIIICMLLYGIALVTGIVLLFKRNFWTGASWIAVGCSIWLPAHVLNALNEISGDRFTAGLHRKIVDMYHQRQSEFVFDPSKLSGMGPHLVSFDTQCHPRNWCECWVVWDPRHVSGVEHDIGRSHKPKSSIFPTETFWPQFSEVDVKQIDPDAYSVLACPVYPTFMR